MDARYCLVDIEIAFKAVKDTEGTDSDKKIDRIDILLYDTEARQLLFCEAKRYSNSEIQSKDGGIPKVIHQLESYNRQIAANKENILKQYISRFEEYNTLMGTALKPPTSIYPECGLLIFGYNEAQEKVAQGLLDSGGRFFGHKCRVIGGADSESAAKLFKALT
jgi:hypothetical protein